MNLTVLKQCLSHSTNVILVILTISIHTESYSQRKPAKPKQKGGVEVIPKPAQKRVDILIDGKLFTSYRFPDETKKPVLWPISAENASSISDLKNENSGVFPGLSLNQNHFNTLNIKEVVEEVNPHPGNDFGTIFHKTIDNYSGSQNKGELAVTAEWRDAQGKPIVLEKTYYTFEKRGKNKIISKRTELQSLSDTIRLNHLNDGLFFAGKSNENSIHFLDDEKKISMSHSKWVGSGNNSAAGMTIFEHPENQNLIKALRQNLPDSVGKQNSTHIYIPPGKRWNFSHRVVVWTGEIPDHATLLKYYQDWTREPDQK